MKKITSMIILVSQSLLSSNVNTVIGEALDARFRTYYESIPLSKNRDMGIVGTHFDFFPFNSLDEIYMGPGFISSINGEEGGFFSYGYTIGFEHEFYKNFHFDSGIYLGGGAGDYIGFNNGGMILRSHAALSYRLKELEVVAGFSKTDFPNTKRNRDYESDIHPYIGLNINSNLWNQSDNRNKNSSGIDFNGLFHNIRVTPLSSMQKVDNKPTKKGNTFQEDFPMIGVEFDKFISDKMFVAFGANAALSSAAGYMDLKVGLGYDYKLSDSITWESKMMLGSAGDSKIDTGGGLSLQPMTGLRFALLPSFSLETLVGRTYAPTGLFSASTYEVGLSWETSIPTVKEGKYLFGSNSFDRLAWTLSPGIKTYLPYDSTHKSNGEDGTKEIGLIGITAGIPINKYLSFIGSTYWATTGNIGSYAEGLLGAKISSPKFTPWDIKAVIQGQIGAGAGDGINTASGGYVTEFLAGFDIPLTDDMSININGGSMKTSDGTFKADTLSLSLTMNLDLITKK